MNWLPPQRTNWPPPPKKKRGMDGAREDSEKKCQMANKWDPSE
jgi:hypothetical protein